MKHSTAVRAFKILYAIGETKLSAEAAYKLFKLRKALQPEFDFQLEQEQKCVDKYNATVDENGIYKTKNPADMKALATELKDVANLDCMVSVEPVEVTVDKSLHLSLNDMEALEPFVRFIFKNEEMMK